ncbi:hypothetical protein BDW67DRAFT_112303 [Aspergillus spinulosporus]
MEGDVHRDLARAATRTAATRRWQRFSASKMPAGQDCMLRSIRSTTHASTRQFRFGLQSSLVSPLLLAASDRERVDSQPRLGASWQSPILLSTNDVLVWVFSWFSRLSLGFSVTFLADSHGLINLLFLFVSPLLRPPLPSPSLPVPPPSPAP